MRTAIIVLVGVILAGCQCRRCEAQTPTPVVVSATEAKSISLAAMNGLKAANWDLFWGLVQIYLLGVKAGENVGEWVYSDAAYKRLMAFMAALHRVEVAEMQRRTRALLEAATGKPLPATTTATLDSAVEQTLDRARIRTK